MTRVNQKIPFRNVNRSYLQITSHFKEKMGRCNLRTTPKLILMLRVTLQSHRSKSITYYTTDSFFKRETLIVDDPIFIRLNL